MAASASASLRKRKSNEHQPGGRKPAHNQQRNQIMTFTSYTSLSEATAHLAEILAHQETLLDPELKLVVMVTTFVPLTTLVVIV